MKAILIPLVLLLLGTGAGVGAGLFLAPSTPQEIATADQTCTNPDAAPVASDGHTPDSSTGEFEYVKLNNQFIVPVVEDAEVKSLVVMSLNLEVSAGSQTAIFAVEPKLRDRFLRVMFDHANKGGFSGNFTTGTKMLSLRNALLDAAHEVSGSTVNDVLVLDLVRQDS